MSLKWFLVAIGAAFATGCATYPYADNVKMIGFSEDASRGKSVGNIEGEDCQWIILGYQTKEAPQVDRALSSARSQNNVRYMNNVTSKNNGFNAAGLVAKNCIVVTGVGYK